MNAHPPTAHGARRTSTRAMSLLIVAALLLTSCAPIAASLPAPQITTQPTAQPGGPTPPLGRSQPLVIPGESEIAAANLPTPTPPPPAPTFTPTPAQPTTPLAADAARNCLDDGKVLYGLALQNTNVRQTADSSSCRVGRIPKGSLVRVIGYQQTGGAPAEALVALPTPTTEPSEPAAPTEPAAEAPVASDSVSSTQDAPRIGYLEDIQPIFVRVCNTCHSAIVRNKELQVTTYAGVMKGSTSGPVIVPGDPVHSILWQQLEINRMPMVGSLTDAEKALIKQWIETGAHEQRPPAPAPTPAPVATPEAAPQQAAAPASGDLAGAEPAREWLVVDRGDYTAVLEPCANPAAESVDVVSSELILPVACNDAPQSASLDALRAQLALPIARTPGSAAASSPVAANSAGDAATAASGDSSALATAPSADASAGSDALASQAGTQAAAPPAVAPSSPAFAPGRAADAGIQAPALGLPAAADTDGWLQPRGGGLCVERKLPDNKRGITAMTFAPDGRLFLALDSDLATDVDPLILYEPRQPSRSIAVVDSSSMQGLTEILKESPRITGLDWDNGNLFVSRAGEVGVIPDGGEYDTLASGFAVTGRLFHANNGLAISDGWLYMSDGGVIDGYSDGPLVGMDEAAAQQIASGGNPWAARIVRAPIDQLLSQKSISAFSTAARGTRNPYGITVAPSGLIWFTDNGSTNVPEGVSAGDEVNVLNPASAGSSDADAPYYGFPLALTEPKDWYMRPAVVLENTAAPTGITWALGTIYFSQYGRDPGLYRIGMDAAGTMMAERVMLGWPILSLATAPDGALWMGMGDGGLFRITTGC